MKLTNDFVRTVTVHHYVSNLSSQEAEKLNEKSHTAETMEEAIDYTERMFNAIVEVNPTPHAEIIKEKFIEFRNLALDKIEQLDPLEGLTVLEELRRATMEQIVAYRYKDFFGSDTDDRAHYVTVELTLYRAADNATAWHWMLTYSDERFLHHTMTVTVFEEASTDISDQQFFNVHNVQYIDGRPTVLVEMVDGKVVAIGSTSDTKFVFQDARSIVGEHGEEKEVIAVAHSLFGDAIIRPEDHAVTYRTVEGEKFVELHESTPRILSERDVNKVLQGDYSIYRLTSEEVNELADDPLFIITDNE